MRYYNRKIRCAICGKRSRPGDPMTQGHILPAYAGGTLESWNIRPEHRSCNSKRGMSYTREDMTEAMLRKYETTQKKEKEPQQ